MAGISDETYRELQRILERQNGKGYALEEVKEIGDGLIDLYKLLAEFDIEAERGRISDST